MTAVRIRAQGKALTCYQWAGEIGCTAETVKKFVAKHGSDDGIELLMEHAKMGMIPGEKMAPGQPGSSTWACLEWEDDPWAQYVVKMHPGGLTLIELGALLGVSRERIRQIEAKALNKLSKIPEAREWLSHIRAKLNSDSNADRMEREA